MRKMMIEQYRAAGIEIDDPDAETGLAFAHSALC